MNRTFSKYLRSTIFSALTVGLMVTCWQSSSWRPSAQAASERFQQTGSDQGTSGAAPTSAMPADSAPVKHTAKKSAGNTTMQSASKKQAARAPAQTQASRQQNSAAGKSGSETEASSAAPPAAASTAEILSAKSSGKVWVNLDSKTYHKGGRWYGKTKNGKFMTEDEAKKAGYKQSEMD